MYYHASKTAGLVCLEPRVSNHGIPLVYLSSKRENVLVYLSNAVEKFCRETGFSHSGRWSKWGPYGFTETGILRLEEYYPHALEDTYRGVSAYIYSADPPRGLEKLEGIADAYVSKEPVPVMGCEYIADACDAILCAEKEGKIVIRRYEEMTPPPSLPGSGIPRYRNTATRRQGRTTGIFCAADSRSWSRRPGRKKDPGKSKNDNWQTILYTAR